MLTDQYLPTRRGLRQHSTTWAYRRRNAGELFASRHITRIERERSRVTVSRGFDFAFRPVHPRLVDPGGHRIRPGTNCALEGVGRDLEELGVGRRNAQLRE